MSLDHRPPEHPHPSLSKVAGPLAGTVGELIVRQPTAEETVAHRAAVDSAFGSPYKPQKDDAEARFAAMAPQHNRRVVAEQLADGTQRIIGGDIRFDTDLSLPGGGRVGVGALSGVGVEPGATGRGAFRALLAEHLADCRARGDAASVLIASQTPLYPRFGYGCAAQTANWEIDAAAAALQPGAPTAGRVQVEHARGPGLHEVLDTIWQASGTTRAGTLNRSAAWWNLTMDPQESWFGGGDLLVALHSAGSGYVLYTVDIAHGRQGLAEADIKIKELVASDVATELDLWRFVMALPWARRIRWNYGPIDPAARFWLIDQRQLRRMSHLDHLWLRPLDLPVLVASRAFSADGAVALDVRDPMFGDLAGRFDLRVAGGAGSWEAGSGPADLQVSVAELAELWLGGGSASQLLGMRRIGGDRSAAVRLDAMLMTDGPPRSVARF